MIKIKELDTLAVSWVDLRDAVIHEHFEHSQKYFKDGDEKEHLKAIYEMGYADAVDKLFVDLQSITWKHLHDPDEKEGEEIEKNTTD